MKILNIKRKLRQIDPDNWDVKITKNGHIIHGELTGRVGNATLRAHDYLKEGETVEDFLAKDISFFTLLRDGTQYDPGSDYNPSGHIFCYKIKDIDYYAARYESRK